jgi:N-acetylneuraminate lyase
MLARLTRGRLTPRREPGPARGPTANVRTTPLAMPLVDKIFSAERLSLVAVPYTAFTDDGEAIVLGEVEGQARFCQEQGNDVCLLQGTTGEWPSLSLEERVALATEWRRCVPPGSAMKLILHIGHDALPDAKALARLASELKYDGVLLSPPSKFVAADLGAQVACLAEVLAHCSEIPSFYYHYPMVYRDTFDLVELFDLARDTCPSLCGCKLSGAPVEDIERYGAYRPEEYAVITTGHLNLVRSMRLPAVRGAIVVSYEPPIYKPVLDAYYGGRTEEADALEAYINNSRQVVADLNAQLGAGPGSSATAVYCIAANKAAANGLEVRTTCGRTGTLRPWPN